MERRGDYRVVVGGPVPRQAAAITFGNTVIVRRAAAGNDRLMAHELVHVRQYQKLGLVPFLARYVGSYLRLRFAGHSHLAAYRRIPLEVEASWLSRLYDSHSLEPGTDPNLERRDHGAAPVRTPHQQHRGPDRMWRQRKAVSITA